jgi:putative ABC transport system permease protein
VGLLSFVRYSFESIFRNTRRSLFAIIGIVLAIALIAGSSIAVDSSAYGILRSAISSVDVDFTANVNSYNSLPNETQRNAAVAAIESVKNVKEAMPFIVFDGLAIANSTGSVYQGSYGSAYYAFVPEDSARFLEVSNINGVVPEPGTVALPKAVTDELSVSIGDDITCSMQKDSGYYDNSNQTWVSNVTYLNVTVVVSQIWTQDRDENDDNYFGSSLDNRTVLLNGRWGTPIVFDIASYGSIVNSSVATFWSGYYQSQLSYLIWIDRDAVINLANIRGTLNNLEFMQHRLNAMGYTYGYNVDVSPLYYQLESVNPVLEGMKLLFIALSLPVIALGTYLSVVGVDLGVSMRKREVGILKSRGASNRQVFFSLIFESLVLGTSAAVLGLVLGVLVSRFLLDVALSFTSGGTTGETSMTDIKIGLSTIELAVLFGVGLMFLSSYRPFKRVSKTDIAEALHHYSPMVMQVDYKPRTDIILLSVSVLSVASVLMGADWIGRQGWSWITQLILGAVVIFGVLIFPVMPFLLSLSVIRLLTRGSRRLYAKFTWLVKGWTKELHYLVEKNIVRNPRRASNLCVIISLALAFGLFISVTMESSMAYEKERVKFRVGSDVMLDAYPRGYMSGDSTSQVNLTNLSKLGSISGVEHVAVFERTYLVLDTYGYGEGFDTALLDPSAYAETVRPSDFYFVHSDSDMLGHLEQNGTVILTKDFADSNYLIVGDSLPVRFEVTTYSNGMSTTTTWRFSVSVVGFVKALPGLTSSSIFIGIHSLDFIPEQNLTQQVFSVGAFIDISGDADAKAVANSATSMFGEAGLTANAYIMEDEIAALERDPAFGALADFLYLEYAMSIVIMSVGVGLIIFVAVTDREQELACIMARGSSGSQMRKILMGESLTLMAIGLVVGAIIGLLTSYLFNTLTTTDSFEVVPRRMVFTYVTWVVVVVSIASLLLASLLATARAGRIKLAEVLRVRGG